MIRVPTPVGQFAEQSNRFVNAMQVSKLTGADLRAARFTDTDIRFAKIPSFNSLTARAQRPGPVVAATGDDDLMSQPQIK